MNLHSKGLNFVLVNKEIPVLNIMSSVKWGIRDLHEEDKNEIQCLINLEMNKKRSVLSNVKKDEYESLKYLQRNTEITIMRADKGRAIVILKKRGLPTKNGRYFILTLDEYVLLSKDPTPEIKEDCIN